MGRREELSKRPVRLEVWGEHALFTRPEMKVERVSYDVMTPSAARNILQAIYWHPQFDYVIDKIIVMNPIKTMSIKRNEVDAVASARSVSSAMNGNGDLKPIYTSKARQQRNSLILKDVRYVIEHHIVPKKGYGEDTLKKTTSIYNDRVDKGRCFHQPYLGCREFPAYFKAYYGPDWTTGFENGERDLGYMLFDMDYHDKKTIRPEFFKAKLVNGVLNVPDPKSSEVLK